MPIWNSKKVLSARSHTKRSWENQTISMWFVLFWNRSKVQLKEPHPSSSWQNQAISMSNVFLWGNPEKTIITTYSSRSRRNVATVTTCLWLKQNYFHGNGSKYENILDTQSWYLLASYRTSVMRKLINYIPTHWLPEFESYHRRFLFQNWPSSVDMALSCQVDRSWVLLLLHHLENIREIPPLQLNGNIRIAQIKKKIGRENSLWYEQQDGECRNRPLQYSRWSQKIN